MNLEDGRLDSLSTQRQAALELALGLRRELLIFSHDLDPLLLDREDWLEAVRQFVIRSRHTRARILVIDSTRAIREGHGLVRLAQRLSSHIAIHRAHPDDADNPDAFLVADGVGYLHRPNATRWEGSWARQSGAEARRLEKRFDTMWERSQPETEFRNLKL